MTTSPFFPWQTRQGDKIAKGPTADEFWDVVSQIKAAYSARVQEWNREHPDQQVADRPIWSWDNAGIHGSVSKEKWLELGISRANQTCLPPYSPDMHCVIENCHGVVSQALQQWINEHEPKADDTLQLYMDQLIALHKQMINDVWVKHAVWRLFQVTLPAILDAAGEYPEKHCR